MLLLPSLLLSSLQLDEETTNKIHDSVMFDKLVKKNKGYGGKEEELKPKQKENWLPSQGLEHLFFFCYILSRFEVVLAFVSRSVVIVSGVEAARWRPCQLVVMLLIGLQQFIGARGDGKGVIPGK